MELSFEPKTETYLRPVVSRVVSQEETGEAIVPDSCPDIVRTAGCFGTVVLRGKECRDGSVVLSGGIRAHVLVVPEDETYPRAIELYLPFTQRVDAPEVTSGSRVVYEARLRSLDARLLNSRKVLIRADLSGHVEAFEPAEVTTWSLLDCPPEIQAHRVTLPVTLTSQTAEKSFVVGEELELPASQPACAAVLKWDCTVSLGEEKLIGARAVFKGTAAVRLLYRTEDGSLCRYEFAVPFSQFAELDREGGEEDLRVVLMCTGAELEPDGQDPARRFLLTLNVLAQCVTQDRTELELIDDLYATRGAVTVRSEPFSGVGVLDVQRLRQSVRGTVSGECNEVIDTSVLLDWPSTEHEGDAVRVRVPAAVTVLSLDTENHLQARTERMEAVCETVLAPGCDASSWAQLTGDVFASPSGDGAEARFTVECVVTSSAPERCAMVTGAELTESDHEPVRPSVILRAVEEGETLWSIAKACRTCVDAVSAANALDDEPTAGMLLLIPRA